MTGYSVQKYKSLSPVLWKNQKGVTREILTETYEGGDCRISIADLECDSIFSSFPGTERCFTIIGNSGVGLKFNERLVDVLPFDPIRFSGAETPLCTLAGAETKALNVMLSGRNRRVSVEVGKMSEVLSKSTKMPLAVINVSDSAYWENERLEKYDTVVLDQNEGAVCVGAPFQALYNVVAVYLD